MATKLKKLVTVLMAICMIAATAAMASALEEEINNTSNTDFNLKVNPNGYADYDHTSWRTKDNSSAVYMKVNYVKYTGHRVSGWIQGKKNGKVINCSGGNYYAVNRLGVIKMTNYVKEHGCTHARIKVGADPSATNIIQGVWSPDSR